MATALHTWLSQAQETTRYDSVAAKYGLVVDTPSGMSQTGQNALRFLRSLTEHSPTFFEDQAKLLSPPTPDLVPDLPASPLATPMSMSGPQRTPRRSNYMPRSPYALTYPDAESDALFAFDMPSDEPVFVPNVHVRRPTGNNNSTRARPYPACRAYVTSPTAHPAETSVKGGVPPLGYFPPAPDPSPALDMFSNSHSHSHSHSHGGWDSKSYPTPTSHYPTYASTSPVSAQSQSYTFQPQAQSQFVSQQQQQQQQQTFGHGANPASPTHTELDMHLGDDADRARMSALMYGSMRVRAVVAASEADGQGW